MQSNAQVILTQILEQKQQELFPELSGPEYFEVFSAEQILKDYDLSYEEIQAGIVDGEHDGGIDSVYTFVNGELINEDTTLESFKKGVSLELHIVQSKSANGFSEASVNSLTATCERLLDLSADYAGLTEYNNEVKAAFDIFRRSNMSLAARFPAIRIIVYFAAMAGDKIHENLQKRTAHLVQKIEKMFASSHVSVLLLGARQLLDMAQRRPSSTHELTFTRSMSDKDSFVLLAKVSDYARFLAADGKLRTELFESNVRDYQGTTEVNGEIGRSLKEDKKIEFWWMNNGVTILSSRASLNGDVVTIENPQIVNGLQTSKKIFESQPFDEDDKRAVLVKIISSDDDEARDKIIKATNSQNPIQPATLRATDKVQRDIEEALRPYGYFYDRRKNYYKNIGKPAKSIISIPLMAQCSMSLILQQPDTARARPSSLIKDNEAYMKVFASDHPIDFYLNAARLISAIDGELRSRTDLSARDRNNIRFYALRWLGSELSYKLRPSATDIAQVKLGNNAQSLTKQAVDVALDLYNDNGGTDQLAKGPELLLALDAKIKDDLKSKLMG